jgi:hypothetical protein
MTLSGVRAETDDSEAVSPSDASARLAFVVFAAVIGGAFVLYAAAGRRYWFDNDEWDFLVDRNGGSLQDLLRPHNEHWQTIPIVVYRMLWKVFGLNTYRPYQLLTISLHLTAAILLRVLMRRAGVGPWIATVFAAAFALIGGSGLQNIVWGFQIGFVGSLVCGFIQLIVADHDGPLDRRDALGLTFGIVGLMCSGIAVTMCFVVGLAVLVRRGWHAAAFYTAPPGLLFVAWWLKFGRDAYVARSGSFGNVVEFSAIGVSNVFARIGHLPSGGFALSLVLVAGLALAWRGLPRARLRQQAAAPGALLVGCLVFFVITATGRAVDMFPLGPETARAPRYVHLAAAMILPALAVATDAVARRWRLAAPLLIVLVLLGVPGNIETMWTGSRVGDRSLILALGQVPLAREVPGDVHPIPRYGYKSITVGWLREGVESGKIPRLAYIHPDIAADATLRIALAQTGGPDPGGPCRSFTAGTRRLEAGEYVDFAGTVLVRLLAEDGGESVKGFVSADGSRLEALAGPLTLEIAPYPGVEVVECG